MIQVHKYANTEQNTTIEVKGGVIVLGELTEKDKLATDAEEKLLTHYFSIEVATVDPNSKLTKESAKLVIRTEDFPKVVDEIVKFRQLHLK